MANTVVSEVIKVIKVYSDGWGVGVNIGGGFAFILGIN